MFRDLRTLYHIVFPKRGGAGTDHADRLEAFYAPQIEDYDRFREHMLWGREPLLRTLAAHVAGTTGLVWMDIGGGTGANVEMMDAILPIASVFKKVYIVDLCPSMCAAARDRVARRGWTNVEVVCADAADIKPSHRGGGRVDVVTFSYSISMIPGFHRAIDNAFDILADDGFIGVTDFTAHPEKSWAARMFWTAVFDLDGVKLGPERQAYLTHKFHTQYVQTSDGSVPYVPYLKAPYYVWIGTKMTGGGHSVDIRRSRAPLGFPPTFLYHQSWEDPEADDPVLDIQPTDTCLTLTSGGCNTLYLLLKGAKRVVSVDVNPAQTALLELKCVAIKNLEYDDFWRMFGEGRHPEFAHIFQTRLAPFMSQSSREFWERRTHFFTGRDGLYSHGSMGKISLVVRAAARLLGVSRLIQDVVEAPSLARQRALYETGVPAYIRNALFERIVGFLAFNRVVSWYAGGVPPRQLELIKGNGISVMTYFKRVLNGVLKHSYICKENYFYYNILTGRYDKNNCPAYLKPENFRALKDGLIDNLHIRNNYFLDELRDGTYDKVILMDHADWQTVNQTIELAHTLYQHTTERPTIIFRSAAALPPYVDYLRAAGFKVSCVKRIDQVASSYIDRVNMYASFWVARK